MGACSAAERYGQEDKDEEIVSNKKRICLACKPALPESSLNSQAAKSTEDHSSTKSRCAKKRRGRGASTVKPVSLRGSTQLEESRWVHKVEYSVVGG